MPSRQTFGRRVSQQAPLPRPQPAPLAQVPRPDPAPAVPAPASIVSAEPDADSVTDELKEWQAQRRKAFRIPWRQLYVMAGLCFGVASCVLPDSINDAAQWPLGALMLASFYAGWRKRKDAGVPTAAP